MREELEKIKEKAKEISQKTGEDIDIIINRLKRLVDLSEGEISKENKWNLKVVGIEYEQGKTYGSPVFRNANELKP